MIFGFTLQDKFGILIAAIITVVLAGMSFFFYLQLETSLMNSLRTELTVVSKIVASQIKPETVRQAAADGENSPAYRDINKYLKGIELQDNKIKSIRLIFKATKDKGRKSVADEVISKDKNGSQLIERAPVYDRQGRAIAVVAVGMSADEVNDMRGRIRDMVVICFAIGLAFSIVFGRIGAITITNPILSILSGIRDIEEGKYGTRIELNSRDEIGKLVAGFNRMSNKLGEVDKLKAEFLSVISHELNTPITPIKDSAMQLGESKTLSETDKQLVSIIKRQTGRLQDLVEEVLDFSWLEVKEWKLNKEPASIGQAGEAAVDMAIKQAEGKSIKIRLKLAKDLPAVMADKKRIQHVIKILLENAVKFSPEGSEIVLGIDKVSGGIEIYVLDAGIGISKENLEKIFSGFYQAEDHLTRTKGGMGLGLAIAKRIIEAHNGYIWAESQGFGEGSRFVFLLPII